MLAQNAFGTEPDGSRVYYSDAQYFGGYGYLYFIGVDGGATFFNNHIATTFDFVSRIAGALLSAGTWTDSQGIHVRARLSCQCRRRCRREYKSANHVNAVKGLGGIITHYNQEQPLQQVVIVNTHPVDLPALVNAAYHDMFIKAMRVPVVLQAMHSAGTPFSGTTLTKRLTRSASATRSSTV